MSAINYFYHQHSQHFKTLNSTHICLIPKKADARTITGYRPISLLHSIAKIISKLLANRLVENLNDIISGYQNAFIKRRSIHDNFLYTQNLVKELHQAKKKKQPSS